MIGNKIFGNEIVKARVFGIEEAVDIFNSDIGYLSGTIHSIFIGDIGLKSSLIVDNFKKLFGVNSCASDNIVKDGGHGQNIILSEARAVFIFERRSIGAMSIKNVRRSWGKAG